MSVIFFQIIKKNCLIKQKTQTEIFFWNHDSVADSFNSRKVKKKFHGIYQTHGSVKGKLRYYGKYESILITRGFTTEKSVSE